MPFTRSGKHYSMRAKRLCQQCHDTTWQMCCTVRYSQWPEPSVPTSLKKEMEWICDICTNVEKEIKQIFEPTDKLRIINRLLRLPEDYDFIKVQLSSLPNEVLVSIQLPDFDPSEMRAIQTKQQETGFINVGELIQLQRAGFHGPKDVPPKLQPKDRATLRERARQRMFEGQPRSI